MADHDALDLYEWLQKRVVRELALTPLVFDVWRLALSPAEARGLLVRLDRIHEAVAARPVTGGGEEYTPHG